MPRSGRTFCFCAVLPCAGLLLGFALYDAGDVALERRGSQFQHRFRVGFEDAGSYRLFAAGVPPRHLEARGGGVFHFEGILKRPDFRNPARVELVFGDRRRFRAGPADPHVDGSRLFVPGGEGLYGRHAAHGAGLGEFEPADAHGGVGALELEGQRVGAFGERDGDFAVYFGKFLSVALAHALGALGGDFRPENLGVVG